MNIECALGRQCDSHLLLPVFDMLLSPPLIRSNNSHLHELLPSSPEMIYEALNFKLQGHCWSCRLCDTAHSSLFLLQPHPDTLPLPSLQHPFFQPVFPYLFSLHRLFSYFVSQPFCFPLYCPTCFHLWTVRDFPSLASVLLTGAPWLQSSLFFLSLSLQLPTRLIIMSSTVELMAQFKKMKKGETIFLFFY